MTPEDLLALEDIGDVALAPDGHAVAFVRRRPLLLPRQFAQDGEQIGNDRGDIWVASFDGRRPRNITFGASDETGFWSPVWSPDSARLAMLSSRGTRSGATVWVWDETQNQLRQASPLTVEQRPRPFTWVGPEALAVWFLPPDFGANGLFAERNAAEAAAEQWTKARGGKEPSASVLESAPVANEVRAQRQLTLIRLKGNSSPIATTDYGVWIEVPAPEVSPDGRHVAFVRQTSRLPMRLGTPLQQYGGRVGLGYGGTRFSLFVAGADTHPVVSVVVSKGPVVLGTPRWANNGHAVAWLETQMDADEKGPFCVRVADPVGKPLTFLGLNTLNASKVLWTAGGRLLVLGQAVSVKALARQRQDWWRVSHDREPVNLTVGLRTVPSELMEDPSGTRLIGVSDGNVWSRGAEDSSEMWRNVSGDFTGRLAGIAWASAESNYHPRLSHILLSTRPTADLLEFFRFDVRAETGTSLTLPTRTSTLVAYDVKTGRAVIKDEGRVTSLISLAGGQRHALVELNTQLGRIIEGEVRRIGYRSLNGERLDAWLVLPVGYQAGKRYPMIVWVYPQWTAGHAPPDFTRAGYLWGGWRNCQILAARGYAVLLPSMPRTLHSGPVDDPLRAPPSVRDPFAKLSSADDPYMDLPNGVLPAVDKAIELGIADSRRVGLLGHSFGGYAVLGLITQTKRFAAAVESAGVFDLFSYYSSLVAVNRYSPYAHDATLQSIAETGQFRLGVAPWQDFMRYIRNSPSTYADRIETPLLIFHGDMDVIPFTQAEAVFTALSRQGKRARFVRYWGEGHTLKSPANIVHGWHQLLTWFDEFLSPTENDSNSTLEDHKGQLPL